MDRMRHSIPFIKLLTLVLLCVLSYFEIFDSEYNAADYAIPFLIAILINDIYIRWKKNAFYTNASILKDLNSFSLKTFFTKDRSREQKIKMIMNFIFFIVLSLPFIFTWLNVNVVIQEDILKIGTITWAGAFLTISLRSFQETKKVEWLVFCQLGVFFLVGSLLL